VQAVGRLADAGRLADDDSDLRSEESTFRTAHPQDLSANFDGDVCNDRSTNHRKVRRASFCHNLPCILITILAFARRCDARGQGGHRA
jgi:hypothetical protein